MQSITESVRQIQKLNEAKDLRFDRKYIKWSGLNGYFTDLGTHILYHLTAYTGIEWTYEMMFNYIVNFKKYKLDGETEQEYEQRCHLLLDRIIEMGLIIKE